MECDSQSIYLFCGVPEHSRDMFRTIASCTVWLIEPPSTMPEFPIRKATIREWQSDSALSHMALIKNYESLHTHT